MREMNLYKLYGYVIDSAVDLNLPPSPVGDADIIVRLAPEIDGNFPEYLKSSHFEDQYQRLYWPFLGIAEIYFGKKVIFTPLNDVDISLFSFALVGPVIGMILHTKSFLTLHASCIALEGKGVAFMGDKGAGKSTIAAALIEGGHQLVADDIAAIKVENGLDVCQYGYPSMKLSEATLSAFPKAFDGQPQFARSPIGDKHIVKLPEADRTSVPLASLFLLGRGSEPRLRRLTDEEAFACLMRYSYPIRFGNDVLRISVSKSFLENVAATSNRIPVYELTSVDSIDQISESVKLVEQAVTDGR